MPALRPPNFIAQRPAYFYAPIIAGTFFAWSLLLPESHSRRLAERKRWSRADRLLIVWAIVVVCFYLSISQSKLPGYILTAVMALGILTARVFAMALDNGAGRAAGIRMAWNDTSPAAECASGFIIGRHRF